MSEHDEIEQSLRRIALGHGDELDHWRARAAQRREERTMSRNDNDPDPNAGEAWNRWFDDRFDAVMKAQWVDDIGGTIAEARRDMRDEFKTQLHKLELEVAELRGELRALRAGAGKSEVIELPKMAWNHGNAA
jgi:hypothetical protein